MNPRHRLPTRSSATLRAIASVAFAVIAYSQFAGAGINAWTTTGPRGGWTFLAADPLVPDRVFAASNAGLYRSVDGAVHWSAAHGPNTVPPVMAFDSNVPGRIYAAFGPRLLHRSDDGGASWSYLSSVQPHEFIYSGSVANVWRLAVSPHRNTDIYLSDGALSYSGDAGATFTQIFGPSFIYDFVLDPIVPSSIYIADHADTVAKSTDNGLTWIPLVTGLPTGLAGIRLAVDPSMPSHMYLVAAPRFQAIGLQYEFDQYSVYVLLAGTSE